jgi:PRMT5 oligomerisation domain
VRVVPHELTLHVAPVEVPAVWRHIAAFSKPRYGIAWDVAHQLATHNVYNTTITPRALLAPAATVATIDLERGEFAGSLSATASWHARRAATVHGFAGWFEDALGEGITLSTAPGKPATIWRQVMFPLPAPVRVAKGTTIEIALAATGVDFDWSGAIGGAAFKCSTRYSYP